jgi:hypothetical protein
MNPSLSKGSKAGAGKKRSRSEADGSAQVSSPPTSPPRPNLAKEWENTTKNLVIHDDIHMTFSDFVTDHIASMTNCQISS